MFNQDVSIKLKHYVDTAVTRSEKNIVNFSAEAKSSKEVSDGVTKIYPNTVTKTIVFETIDNNDFKTVTINPSAGIISLSNGSISGISDSAGDDSTIALSQCALINTQEQIDELQEQDKIHDTRITNVEDSFKNFQHYIVEDIIDHNCEFNADFEKQVFTIWFDQIYTDNEVKPVVFIGDEHGNKIVDLELYDATCDYDWSFKVDIHFDLSVYNIYPSDQTQNYHIYLSRTAYGSFSCESLGQLQLQTEYNQYASKAHTHTINDIEGCDTRITNGEDKTRLITSITDYPFCVFDTTNRTQVLIGNDLHNCINIGHNTEINASFIANSPYGASIDLRGNTVECYKNLSVPGTITSPTIDLINTTIQLDQSLISEHEGRIYKLEEATNDVDFKNMNNLIYENQVKIAALETHNHDLQYAAKNHTHDYTSLKTEILKSIYPVGCIYTSMTSTSPATVFGFGTWSQIKDRFLYCTTSSKSTGGSKKITVENLPAHTHKSVVAPDVRGNPDGSADSSDGTSLGQCYWRGNKGKTIDGGNATTSSTGSGTDYMPPYITCYAWYRTS